MSELPELPPLPEPYKTEPMEHAGWREVGIFTADQMRSYARLAVLQERERILANVGPLLLAQLQNRESGEVSLADTYFPAVAHQDDLLAFCREVVAAAIRNQG
jgi:hypothetical protein